MSKRTDEMSALMDENGISDEATAKEV